ncbi:hypothetical protein WR25_13337 [Diploscapter pachys]|uniref:Uncharacterized protein n=1 Tax=Diploscapter pachys TaxID=2018661 RepID=A0A2A2M3D6_9BILA|nr:hypothetical protein WR25_13337 [Diploscapter pachys]
MLFRADQHRADEQIVPGEFVDDAHADAVFGLRSAVQILDEQMFLASQRRQEVGLERGEMLRRHRLVRLAPPDGAVGFGIANDELVLRGPAGVGAGFDDQGSVGAELALAARDGGLDQPRRHQVPMQVGARFDTLCGKTRVRNALVHNHPPMTRHGLHILGRGCAHAADVPSYRTRRLTRQTLATGRVLSRGTLCPRPALWIEGAPEHDRDDRAGRRRPQYPDVRVHRAPDGGVPDPRLFGWRDGVEGPDRQPARPCHLRHQDAADGWPRTASAIAREEPDSGHLPDQQGRRAGRGARPGDGRGRLYRQAFQPTAADRPHSRDPASDRGGGQPRGGRRYDGGGPAHPRAPVDGPGAASHHLG